MKKGEENRIIFLFSLFLFRQGRIQPSLLLIPYGAKDDFGFEIICLYLTCAGISGMPACPDKRKGENKSVKVYNKYLGYGIKIG